MSNLAILQTDKQLDLVRKTVAADLTPLEFNHFIHMAREWGLDPLRRQIYAIVYNKDKAGKRKVTYVTGIDGYRAIANRTSDYRPGTRTVERCERDDTTNPQGILSATASVWKYVRGEWHEFSETVFWEEFAPLKEEWVYDETQSKRVPSGHVTLDKSGQWGRMGATMLMKCAEAQALRRGWPDDLGSLYISEEMDQAKIIDITPDEQVERAEQTERQARIGGPSMTVDPCDGEPLVAVPMGQFHDWVSDFIRRNNDENPERITLWLNRNREPMRQYWAHDKAAALDLKKRLEIYSADDGGGPKVSAAAANRNGVWEDAQRAVAEAKDMMALERVDTRFRSNLPKQWRDPFTDLLSRRQQEIMAVTS